MSRCNALILLLMSGLLACPPPAATAADPVVSTGDTAQHAERIGERDRLDAQVRVHLAAGQLPQAIQTAEKMLAVEVEVLGTDHDDADGSRRWLAEMHALQGDAEAAKKYAQESLDNQTRLHGAEHWQTRGAQHLLSYIAQIGKLDATQRTALAAANQQYQQVEALARDGNVPAGVALIQSSVDTWRKLVGEGFASTAERLTTLARLQNLAGSFDKSAASADQAAVIDRKVLGEHPDTALALEWAGIARRELAQFDKSAAALTESWAMRKKVYGDDKPLSRVTGSALAGVYIRWGDELEEKDDPAGTKNARAQWLAINKQLYPADGWQMQDPTLALARAERLATLTPEQRKKLAAARAAHNQGNKLYRQDKSAEGRVLVQQAYDARKELLGAEDELTANSLNVLGLIDMDLANHAQAEGEFQQAIAIWVKNKTEKHPDVALGYVNLASNYERMNELEKAAAAFRKGYEGYTQSYGKQDSDTQNALSRLLVLVKRQAGAAEQKQDYPGADKYWTDALSLSTDAFGANDWRAVDNRQALENVRLLSKMTAADRKRLVEAEALLSQTLKAIRGGKAAEGLQPIQTCLKTRTELLGPEHPATTTARTWLAFVYRWTEKFADAEKEMRTVIELGAKSYGTNHPSYAQDLQNLGHIYLAQNKLKPASELYREAYAIRKRTEGLRQKNTTDAGDELITALDRQAAGLEGAGDYAKARPFREEAVAIHQEVRGPRHWITINARYALDSNARLATLDDDQRASLKTANEKLVEAGQLSKDKKPVAALSAAEQSLRIRQQLLGDNDRLTAVSRYWVGLYTCYRGDVKAGLQLLLANQETFKQTLGTDHPEYAHALLGIANVYQATGDQGRANQLIREALAVRTRGLGPQHADTKELQKLVLGLLEAQVAELDQQRDLGPAKAAWTEILAMRKQLFGDKSWQANDAQWALYRTQLLPTLNGTQRQELQQADQWMARANHFLNPDGEKKKSLTTLTDAQWRKEAQNNQAAREAASSAVTLRSRVLGENNPLTADALEALASAQVLIYDPAGVKASLDRALAIRKQTQGETHPAYVRLLESRSSELARASAIPYDPHPQLTAAQKKRLEERDRMYDVILKAQRDGNTNEEARQLQAMLAIEREIFGDYHSEVSATYLLLAQFYSRIADYRGAGRYYAAREKVDAQLHGAESWQATEDRYRTAEMERCAKITGAQWRTLGNALNYIAEQKKKGIIVDYGQEPTKLNTALQSSEGLRQLILEIVGQDNLEYANCLEGQAAIYNYMNNQEEAVALRQQAAELTARLLTPHHPMSRARLDGMASEYSRDAEFAEIDRQYEKAFKAWKKHIEIQTIHYGAKHWRVATARMRLTTCERMSKLAEPDQLLLRKAIRDSGHTLEQTPPLTADGPKPFDREQQHAVFAKLLGEDDPITIQVLEEISDDLVQRGKIMAAIPLVLRQLESYRRMYGQQHPRTGSTANKLGLLYYRQGDFAQAEPLFQEARNIYESLKWNSDPAYVDVLNNQAVLYEALGDMDRAEPILRRVVTINPPIDNDIESHNGESAYDIRDYETIMAGFNVAEALKKDTIEGAQRSFSRDFSKLARYMNNLALVCQSRQELDQAENLLRQSLWMVSLHHSIDSFEYATALANLAIHYKLRGQLDQAEELLKRVVQIRHSESSPSPKYAQALSNLASVYFQQGKLDQAAENWQQALKLRRQLQGDRHPASILTLSNLAVLADRQGNSAGAAKALDAVIQLATDNLALAASIQSERQQLLTNNMLRGYLDEYLSISARAKLPAEQVYRHVLNWKGQVASRQRRMRQLRTLAGAQQSSAAAKIYGELDTVNRELASLTFAVGGDQDLGTRERIVELSLKQDELEKNLAKQSSTFDQLLKNESPTPAQFKARLPKDTVLVDIVAYEHVTPASEPGKERTRENRLAAFVVRADRDIVQIDLGPTQALDELVEECHRLWSTGRRAADGDPPVQLRDKLWTPLAAALEGAKTVLVSPDGAISRVPLAALPGKAPGSYLLEEVALAVVPVPQLLSEQLAASLAEKSAASSLLLVGDVDFDAAPGNISSLAGEAAPREGSLGKFGALPGTLTELQALEKVYAGRFKQAPPKVLSRTAATESAFRQQAPGAHYLHLATHGFFAPPEFKAARRELAPDDPEGEQRVEGWNPALLSGIVLAGANQPVSTNHDDGILTAAEVANLDLSAARLVVLSACETGLGQSAGGEGTLGLQRAFQTAGAGSVISSLWKVDDAATQLLMTHFYKNLWEKNLPPMVAFREAQLSLLRGTVDTSSVRGLELAEEEPAPGEKAGRLSPRLWAAFTISGSPN